MKIEKCAINNNTVHNDVIGIYINSINSSSLYRNVLKKIIQKQGFIFLTLKV